MKARKLKGYKRRVETGPVSFGPDWAGVFIRGDGALFYGWTLQCVVKSLILRPSPDIDSMAVIYLKQLADLLESCRVTDNGDCQRD